MQKTGQKENERVELTIYIFSLLKLRELMSGRKVSPRNVKNTTSKAKSVRCAVTSGQGSRMSRVGRIPKLI